MKTKKAERPKTKQKAKDEETKLKTKEAKQQYTSWEKKTSLLLRGKIGYMEDQCYHEIPLSRPNLETEMLASPAASQEAP